MLQQQGAQFISKQLLARETLRNLQKPAYHTSVSLRGKLGQVCSKTGLLIYLSQQGLSKNLRDGRHLK